VTAEQCVRAAAAAAWQWPRQGCRDSRPPPPARGAATPARRATNPVRPRRPGLAGRAATPAAQAPALLADTVLAVAHAPRADNVSADRRSEYRDGVRPASCRGRPCRPQSVAARLPEAV